MKKTKIVSVPLSNHTKLIEMGNMIREKKAKRLFFSMDEFYYEIVV